MLPFNKLGIKFDVGALAEWLESSELWGEYPQRCLGDSPHRESEDIWVRYKNPEEHIKSGDWSGMADPHKSEWLKDIPEVKAISDALMGYLDGEALGGVLITRLEPGKVVYPHTDRGWHAENYDKYYVAIQNNDGAIFGFDGGDIAPKNGDVYAFRNDVNHWVVNGSKQNRIAMIVCIKQDKLDKGGHLCLGQQQQH